MLVELGLVEQRYKAISEILVDGATVTDVARRLGVSRQTAHLAAPLWQRRHGRPRRPVVAPGPLPPPDAG